MKSGVFKLISLVFLFVQNFGYSQYKLSWVNGFGGVDKDWTASIDVDGNGDIYSTGSFRGTMDIDPGPATANITSLGFEDAFVVKYDAAGNFVWGFSIGSSGIDNGMGITVDNVSGFVYVVGGFMGPIDIDPGAGTFNLVPNTNSAFETFVAKYDLNGNFICGFRFEGTSGMCSNYAFSISKVVAGEFIIGGYFTGTVDFDPSAVSASGTDNGNGDMYLAKINQSCSLVWVKTIGGTTDEFLRSVEQAPNGDIFLAGSYRGIVDFDPGSATNSKTSVAGGYDIFIAKFDQAGNHLWANSIGGSTVSTDEAFSTTVDLNGDMIVAGMFYGTVDFDPQGGVSNLVSNTHYSGFFGKYDGATGNLKWIKGIIKPGAGNSVKLYSITTDQRDHIYVWGQFESGGSTGLNVDPKGDPKYVLNVCNPALLNMEFLAHYDQNGDIQCANTICPSTALGQTYIKDKALRVYKDEAIYMAGVYNSNNISSPPCNNSLTIPFSGTFDAYVAKFNMKHESDITAAKDSICYGDSLLLSASGGTLYNWSNGAISSSIVVKPATTQTYSVIVSDVCGCTRPDTSYFIVKVNSISSPLIVGDSIICEGDTVKLQANGQPGFIWSTGATTNYIEVQPLVTTVYQINSGNLCPGPPDTHTVIVNPLPVVNSGVDITITRGESTSLFATGATNWLWTPAEGLSCSTCKNPIVNPSATTTYCVFGKDANGCKASDCVTITVEDEIACGDFFIPNAFSPNGDDQNDVYYLLGNCVQQLSFSIYDRWGEKIFETNNMSNGWDGTYHEKKLGSAVFAYSITVLLVNGKEIKQMGSITLLK